MKNIPYKATWNIPDKNAKHGEEIKNYVLKFFERNLILNGQIRELLSTLNEMFSLTLSLHFHTIDPVKPTGLLAADPLIGMEAVFEGNNERLYTQADAPDEIVQHYSYMRSEYGEITMHDWYKRIEYMVKSLSGTTLTGESSGKTIEIPTFDNPTELKMKLQLLDRK